MCRYSRCMLFFFFKQKTAYEMRISDWSSDVCSSDLRRHERGRGRWRVGVGVRQPGVQREHRQLQAHADDHEGEGDMDGAVVLQRRDQPGQVGDVERSEEHTSELQSLMRISYAVFCLKKQKTKNTPLQDPTPTHPNHHDQTIQTHNT